MLSASCSIETPAFTRRTLDWLKTSLLKGISREGLSFTFSTALSLSDSPRRAAERLSLDLQPVTSIQPLLSLSERAAQRKVEQASGRITRPPHCPRRQRRLPASRSRARNRRP